MYLKEIIDKKYRISLSKIISYILSFFYYPSLLTNNSVLKITLKSLFKLSKTFIYEPQSIM